MNSHLRKMRLRGDSLFCQGCLISNTIIDKSIMASPATPEESSALKNYIETLYLAVYNPHGQASADSYYTLLSTSLLAILHKLDTVAYPLAERTSQTYEGKALDELIATAATKIIDMMKANVLTAENRGKAVTLLNQLLKNAKRNLDMSPADAELQAKVAMYTEAAGKYAGGKRRKRSKKTRRRSLTRSKKTRRH